MQFIVVLDIIKDTLKCHSYKTVYPRIAISTSLPAGRRPRLPEITTTWLEDEGIFQRTDDIHRQSGKQESSNFNGLSGFPDPSANERQVH